MAVLKTAKPPTLIPCQISSCTATYVVINSAVQTLLSTQTLSLYIIDKRNRLLSQFLAIVNEIISNNSM